ncbi:flippase [Candidatus Uhrbacteria bacterium]|nr:flippase [Candidatus Uhrbacteria bacterium]
MTHHITQNTAFLTLASVGQKIIAFVYFLFLARVMMPEATGEYFLAVSITVVFTVVADLGVTPIVIREVAKAPERAPALLSQALALKIPMLILASLFAIATGMALGYNARLVMLIALACIVLSLDAMHLLLYGVLRGFQVLRYESLGVFLGQGTTALLGGLVLWLSPSLPLLIAALMAGSAINVAVAGSMVVRRLGARALVPTLRRTDAGALLRAAMPFALAALFVKLYSYVDSILISKFLDTAAVGMYALAYKFTYAFQFLPLAFTAALYPGMSAVVERDVHALERIFLKGLWYMGILAVPIVLGLWAIAPEAVRLAGPDYAPAAPVLSLLVFVLIPIFLDFPVGSLLNASGRQSTKTVIMGVTMVINIALNVILIPRMGILGAAEAALVCFVFMFVAGMFFVPRVLPGFRYRDTLRLLFPIFFSGALMLGAVLVLKPLIGWILVIPLGAAVYVLSLLTTRALRLQDIRSVAQTVRSRV